MGRLLRGGLVLLLLAVLGVGIFLYLGKTRAEARMRELFQAASDEPVAALAGQIHPTLAAEADPRQLARVLKALVAEHGAFQGLALNGLQFHEKANLGGVTQSCGGTFVFERGAISMEVGLRDSQLVHLEIRDDGTSRTLAALVSKVPADHGPYRSRGRDFWARALDGEAARAFGMLYPALREQFGEGPFVAMMEKLVAENGALETVEFLESRADPTHESKLHLIYRVDLNKLRDRAHVTLQFTGTGSHLVAFGLPSNLPAAVAP